MNIRREWELHREELRGGNEEEEGEEDEEPEQTCEVEQAAPCTDPWQFAMNLFAG